MATARNDPQATGSSLAIRCIIEPHEVRRVLGAKGCVVERLGKDSGTLISVSPTPESIVTIAGKLRRIVHAVYLISRELETVDVSDMTSTKNGNGDNQPEPKATLGILVPSSLCGPLIGTGGSKIRELRRATGSSIHVASETLPNSTERMVTLRGTSNAIASCTHEIASLMVSKRVSKGQKLSYPTERGPAGTGGAASSVPTAGPTSIGKPTAALTQNPTLSNPPAPVQARGFHRRRQNVFTKKDATRGSRGSSPHPRSTWKNGLGKVVPY